MTTETAPVVETPVVETPVVETPVVETPLFEEKEKDAPVDTKKGKKSLNPVFGLNLHDSTLNALVNAEDNLISAITADGFNQLFSQVKANYGIKKGRFYFEFQVLEQTAQKVEFRVGVSTASGAWVGGKSSIAFDQMGHVRANGEDSVKVSKKNITKKDVVGILVNLEPKAENKNTISLFVNGERATEPQAIPECMLKEALFPHFSIRGCTFAVNFASIWKQLPFSVNMIGNAAKTEVTASSIEKVETPKALFPVGHEVATYVEKFLAKEKEHYLPLTEKYVREWIKESGLPERSNFGIPALDTPRLLLPWLRSKPRNVVFALGSSSLLFPENRMKMTQDLAAYECRAVVSVLEKKSTAVYQKFAEACLPTEAEGFKTVTFEGKQKDSEEALEAWKKDQRLRSKVTDLKAGDYWQEKSKAWTTFVAEKKKTPEGKAFSDEDWMLASLRADLVFILNAFKEDVADPERPSFPVQLLAHYYRVYCPKHLLPNAYGCSKLEDLISEHLFDCISVDEDGLLVTSLARDVELETIFQLADTEREARTTRVEAGDELSALTFSAKNPPRQGVPASKFVANKGFGAKGGMKRPLAHAMIPIAQHRRF